jgi:hypothetical protein|nr:MAG TPA: hypothetical protein [Caudoviricetes sp.]
MKDWTGNKRTLGALLVLSLRYYSQAMVAN